MTDRNTFEVFAETWKRMPNFWKAYYYLAFRWHCIPTWGKIIIFLQLIAIAVILFVVK